MRARLRCLRTGARASGCWNFGLAHEHLLMFSGDDLGDTDAKNEWLEKLEGTQISPDYGAFHERWRASLDEPTTRVRTCKAVSRLFVGHGNPSGSEVGLTVHHTWGVPVIPGSALKGLLAHYVATLYGAWPGEPNPDEERERWRGVTWQHKRITRGPGELYRVLFGAPDADDDEGDTSGACAGAVTFHDALFVPGAGQQDRPFARDVLTVHQKRYYDSQGSAAPNDYDEPNPVGFLNVKPGAQFLLALGGPADWTSLAMELLLEALDEWGVGGKTSLGYGRLIAVDGESSSDATAVKSRPGEESVSARTETSVVLSEFKVALRGEGVGVRDNLAGLLERWPERLLALDDRERRQVANGLQKKLKGLKKPRDHELREQLRDWIAQLRGESHT